MTDVTFAVPGDLATPTGGYVYDRHMIEELAGAGWRAEVMDLGEGFPQPTPAVRAAAAARLAALPPGRLVVIDGLALGVLPEAAQALHGSHRLVALVHHPLALETGLAADETAALRMSERCALSFAHGVITSSETTARILAEEFGVPARRMRVVRPGTVQAAVAQRGPSETPTILSVGSVVPRKGYDVLIEALARMADLPWQLLIVGDRTRSTDTVRDLDTRIKRHGLAVRIVFTGAVAPEQLDVLYAAADLFVLASRFEGYGMAYAEAIAHGLPVVGTTAGAIPEAVPPGAGLLVPPDDVDALAAVLRRLVANPSERATLATAAQAAAKALPTWPQQAALFARALDDFR